MAARKLVLDPFCLRQFASVKPTGKIAMSPDQFEATVNELYDSGAHPLIEGYAPFCKHIFIPNFAGLECGYIAITDSNRSLLRSEYKARTEKELPVLERWFPKDEVTAPEAKFLDIILYSREQIRKENAAMGEDSGSDAPWGVVSIKAQDCSKEVPMNPITMMRNALGVDQGGSGVQLSPSAYHESASFWNAHANVL